MVGREREQAGSDRQRVSWRGWIQFDYLAVGVHTTFEDSELARVAGDAAEYDLVDPIVTRE